MGHSIPNQHEKLSVSSDFNETWGTHTLPQVITLHPFSGQSVIWLLIFDQLKYGRFLVPRHTQLITFVKITSEL